MARTSRIHRAPPHQFHRRNAYSFLVNLAAKSHRSRIRSAHIRMMRPRSHVEVRRGLSAGFRPAACLLLHINGRDQGDVGQMRPAAKWIVEHHHVARFHRASINRRPHRHGHRAQMHRHVVAHRDHFARAIKHRARIIAPFFDVRRKRSPAQRRTHLLRNGVIQVLEDFQFDRIAPHEAQCTGNRGRSQRSVVRSQEDLSDSRT